MDWFAVAFFTTLGALLLIVVIRIYQQISSLTSEQKLRFFFYVSGAVMAGFMVIIAADTYARLTIANDTTSIGISNSLHDLFTQPIVTILLLFPFALIGLIAAIFSKDGKTVRGWCLLIGGFLPVIYRYFNGYIGVQHAVQKHAWTAAALSNGFMPFLSLPFIAAGLIVGLVVSGIFDRKRI